MTGALGTWAIAATVVIHGGVAAAIAQLPASEPREETVITIREVKRKPPPPPPPKPAEPPRAIEAAPAPKPVEQPKPAPKPRPAPTPAPAPAPAAPAAPANIGVTMGNATGGDGPALPAPKPADAPPPPPKPKTLEAKPAQTGGCDDPIVKPRPIQVIQPAFTQAARDAGVTGKVRVEITISAAGAITSAKVIAGLGHGLDEAALEAARASKFAPATKCGVAVETTFTIGMRFQ